MSTTMNMVRFLDFEQGSLLVLTEDFNIETGWRQEVRPDFSWWMMEETGAVGYSIDCLDEGPPRSEFLRSQEFYVIAPQLRLFHAGIDEVARAAYSHFVENGRPSHVAEYFERSIEMSGSECTGEDLIHAFQHWSVLYHLYGHTDGLYWMGNTCLRMGMHTEAVRWLEKFLDFHGDHAWAHCDLGSAFYNIGKLEDARRHWQTAVCIDRKTNCDTGAAALLAQLR